MKLSPKIKIFLGGLALFLLSFILRSIKANYFPLWHDEMTTVSVSISYAKALEFARADVLPPFLYIINTFFNHLFHGSIYFQRLPIILAGSLAVVIFYYLLVFLKFKRPLLLSLLPATSFILIFYSQDLRVYSYFVFFALITFYYGYKYFLSEEAKDYQLLILALVFTLFPFFHYFAFFHILALDIILFILILCWAKQKLSKIFNLILLNIFSFIIVIPWTDNFIKNILENKVPDGIVYRLDGEILQNLLYKFSGGAEKWSIFILLITLGTLIFCCYRWWHSWRNRLPLIIADRFIIFSILYLFVYLLIMTFVPFSRFLFWRYFLYLIWPFTIILCYGLSALYSWRIKKIPVGIFAFIIILVAILASNLVDSTAYLLASHRFANWRSMANFVDQVIQKDSKKKVLIENLVNKEDLSFYLTSKVEVENVPSAWRLTEEVNKYGTDNLIYIHIEDKENEMKLEAEKDFSNQKKMWEDKYLDFLNQRKIDPYWGYPIQYGRYIKPVVFY